MPGLLGKLCSREEDEVQIGLVTYLTIDHATLRERPNDSRLVLCRPMIWLDSVCTCENKETCPLIFGPANDASRKYFWMYISNTPQALYLCNWCGTNHETAPPKLSDRSRLDYVCVVISRPEVEFHFAAYFVRSAVLRHIHPTHADTHTHTRLFVSLESCVGHVNFGRSFLGDHDFDSPQTKLYYCL